MQGASAITSTNSTQMSSTSGAIRPRPSCTFSARRHYRNVFRMNRSEARTKEKCEKKALLLTAALFTVDVNEMDWYSSCASHLQIRIVRKSNQFADTSYFNICILLNILTNYVPIIYLLVDSTISSACRSMKIGARGVQWANWKVTLSLVIARGVGKTT